MVQELGPDDYSKISIMLVIEFKMDSLLSILISNYIDKLTLHLFLYRLVINHVNVNCKK